jgi:hypothetical protein
MVELGRVNICCEVSMMLSHLDLPQEGHLYQLYYMFGYLKTHYNAEMVFDPTEPEVDQSQFEWRDWTTAEVTEGLQEVLPPNMPELRRLWLHHASLC